MGMGRDLPMAETENSRSIGRYEDVCMEDNALPVQILRRRMDSGSFGCDFHWHEELEFYCVRQGGVLLLCGGERQWIRAGETGFVNWCQLHRGVKFLDSTQYEIVQISPRLFAGETIVPPGAGAPCAYLSYLIALGNRAPVLLSDAPALREALAQLIQLWETDGPAARLEKKPPRCVCLRRCRNVWPRRRAKERPRTTQTSSRSPMSEACCSACRPCTGSRSSSPCRR